MAKTPLQSSSHHVVPTFTYVKTLVLLTVLMLLTIAASYVDLPGLGPISGTIVNQTVALLIAVVKAAAVIWIFMGIKWSTTLTRLWAVTGFAVFSLMFIILFDYGTRKWEPIPSWDGKGDSALPRDTVNEARNPKDPNDLNVRPRQ